METGPQKNNWEKKESEEQDQTGKEYRPRVIDDGLSFDCEVCQDQGCTECGFRRNKKATSADQ